MIDVKVLKSVATEIRILYVEDEDELRQSIALYLNKIFAHVDIAEDGQQGLTKYLDHEYDLVITDIHMPHMSGLEMIKGIKSFNENQEIIIISAYSDASYFVDAIRLGVTGYILKPVDYAQMNETLYRTVSKLVSFKENLQYKDHLVEMVEKRTQSLLVLEEEKFRIMKRPFWPSLKWWKIEIHTPGGTHIVWRVILKCLPGRWDTMKNSVN